MRAETVEEILQMMGLRVAKKALQDIIAEVDEDGEEGRGLQRGRGAIAVQWQSD